MPVTPTYPGVYVQEIPSGVHTIMGVSTSVTAFVGRAARGPVNEAVTLNSYADFERTFGGLWSESRLGYAVRDFYMNGGSQAIIVRLYHGLDAQTPPANAFAKLTVGALPLVATYPGEWGNSLRVRIDQNVMKGVASQYGLSEGDLYNVTVYDKNTGALESLRNVSVKPGPRQVDKVLANESDLVRVQNGTDVSKITLAAHGDPAAGETIWQSETASTGVKDNDKAADGDPLDQNDFTGYATMASKHGLYALEQADLFNLLCIPPYLNGNVDIDAGLVDQAASYCGQRRAMLLVDPPSAWGNKEQAKTGMNSDAGAGTRNKNAMVYFPRLVQPNPLRNNQMETFVPCGAVAGVIARTDAQRGVWKAPAGLDATVTGVARLSAPLTDGENGELNPLGLNCLRMFPGVGHVVWGARTLQGDDRMASEWKYIPVRRLALYIEESLYRGTKWAVFEPNDEPLWSQLRLNIGAFMHDLFRQGAFQGQKPQDAYFVHCDSTTTTQNDIDKGIVNIVVGFAPLKPAEFVVLSIQQIAGQIQV